MYEVLQRGIRVSSERVLPEDSSLIIIPHTNTGKGELYFSFFTDDGPCLGSRKPNQPYEWQSYREVRRGSQTNPMHNGNAVYEENNFWFLSCTGGR